MVDSQTSVASSKPKAAPSPSAVVGASPAEASRAGASLRHTWQATWQRAWLAARGVARQAEAPATRALHTLGQTAVGVWRPASGKVWHAKQEAQQVVVASWQRLHPRATVLQQQLGHSTAIAWEKLTNKLSRIEKSASLRLLGAWNVTREVVLRVWQRMQPSGRNAGIWVRTAVASMWRGPSQLGARAWRGANGGMSTLARGIKRKVGGGDKPETMLK